MTPRPFQRKNEVAMQENGRLDKDQLLCELEIQKTRAELQIQQLRDGQEQIQLSRDRFAQLYDSAPTGFVTFDGKAQIKWLNLLAAEWTGRPRDQLIGFPFSLFVTKKDIPLFLKHLHRCRLSGGENVETELNLLGKFREKIPVRLLSVGFREAGKALYQTILIDVRASKIEEQVFLEAKEYSEKIIQTVNHPLVVLDENLIVTLANPSFLRLFKLRPREVDGLPLHCVEGSSEEVIKLRGRLRKVVEQQQSFENFPFEFIASKTRSQFLVFSAQPLFRKAHIGPLILLGIEDITKRHEADAVREHLVDELGILTRNLGKRVDLRTSELQAANEKLYLLNARLLEAQESERRHLARELHDEIGQQITCLQILTESQLALAPPSLKRSLKESRRATTELLQTVRQLSADLRPQLLDDFGLGAALEWHFSRFQKRTGIQVKLNKPRFHEELLNSFLRNVLFRVAQEALTNVARHAGTNRVRVDLSTRKGRCRLLVRDKGKGFNLSEALQKGSFGLSGMEERVFLAGGSLKFDSAPGKGTTVLVELPLISAQTNAFESESAQRLKK